MDPAYYFIIGIIVVAGLAVVVLRNKNATIQANREGIKIDHQQPVKPHGVVVDGAIARSGSVSVKSNTGDGVTAKSLDAGQNVTVENNPGPGPKQ